MKYLPFVAASAMLVAVCGSAGFWAAQWYQAPVRPLAAAPKVSAPPPGIEAAAGLFGGAPAAAPTFQLKGVIADGPEGVAILVAAGKPAVAAGVNQQVAPGVTVREIHRTHVMLDDGGTVKRLDLPLAATAGVEIVAAPPSDKAGTPDRPAAPRMTATAVARSGGPMPLPMANPDSAPAAGQAPPQVISEEMIERIRMSRPSGIGPAAFGARPHA
jgi:general secretion pathway protein C